MNKHLKRALKLLEYVPNTEAQAARQEIEKAVSELVGRRDDDVNAE